ncbi:MAG: A/G-specific adenine glycosylase [Limisphaerales bacterium]
MIAPDRLGPHAMPERESNRRRPTNRELTRAVDALMTWYDRHARDLPWRRTRDPYAIWVSEVMLQQTQVRTVIPYWESWIRELPNLAALAKAKEERVLKLWEGLGYYRRARSLQAGARQIMKNHGGVFPADFESILALPGVGRYTAGAIASIAFGQAQPILDGNIIRVFCRWGALPGDPRGAVLNRALWEQARVWVETAAGAPPDRHPDPCARLNQALMELGATVCLPRAPACGECPLADHCRALRTGRVAAYPESVQRARTTARDFVVAVVVDSRNRDRVWLRRRLDEGVHGGLWEFPNLEIEPRSGDPAERVARFPGMDLDFVDDWKPLATVRHAVTRFRMTQHAFLGQWKGRGRGVPGGGTWCGPDKLEALPMSSAHRRIARAWLRAREKLHLG